MDSLGAMGGPMNEAQKKLYKKLLKSLDQKDEDDELNRMAATKETPAEIYARKLALERKDEDMIRAKAERRLKKKQDKEEAAMKIKLENIKKKKVEEQRKKKLEEDAKVKEIEIKTHKFFRLNKYGKGILTGVVYFGDTIRIKDSWIPHGYGEYKVNGEVLYEGDFSRGKMHGRGNYLFANGNTWKGTFRFDELHGVGMLELAEREGVENTGPRECIFHKNKKVCFTDELLPGFHIKLLRQGGYLHSPGATILGKTKKNGHFRVKLDIGGVENINLAEEAFQIDLAKPRITLLEDYVDKAGDNGAGRDGTYTEKRYDFLKDTVEPTYSERQENWYSDKLPPGAEEELAKQEAERKKKEWAERQKRKEAAIREKEKTEEINKAKAEKKAAEEEAKKEQEAFNEEVQRKKEMLLKKRADMESEVKKRESMALAGK
ncbi:hypothetical protein TrRE_jg1607 [Triparma retinervis]|uniref:MORN repeat-containing protein n=1 Tax=Triparma retinervis TaxID=2557542 RepID=A0A9W6Z407_9STRA|nr:hypothetical protein TrRE_jg1607 [Triparma retinervis]